MSQSSGVRTARAMALLGQVGWTNGKVAAEVGVHPRTAARWAAGRHTPTRRNLRALRGLVAQLGLAETAAPRLTAAARLLEQAHDALLTTAERAAQAANAAEMAARLAARRAAQQAAARQQAAELRQILRRPSITAQVDPFELVTSSERAVA